MLYNMLILDEVITISNNTNKKTAAVSCGSLSINLSDKICKYLVAVLLRQSELLFAQRDALHEERHILCQCSHYLKAFCILAEFALLSSESDIPVTARCYRHAADQEVLVQNVT